MPYSLVKAARATGSTILRAIKPGRISRRRDASDASTLEPVELHRIFPPAEAIPRAAPHDAQTDAMVAKLRAQLADMRCTEVKRPTEIPQGDQAMTSARSVERE